MRSDLQSGFWGVDEMMQIQSLELAWHWYALAKCYLAFLPRNGHALSHFGGDMSFLLLGQGSWSRSSCFSSIYFSWGHNKVRGPSLWPWSLGGSWSFLAPRIKEDTRCRHPRQRPKRRSNWGSRRLRTAHWNCKAHILPRDLCCCLSSWQEANTPLFNFPWQGPRCRVAASPPAEPELRPHFRQPQVGAPHHSTHKHTHSVTSPCLSWKKETAAAPTTRLRSAQTPALSPLPSRAFCGPAPLDKGR